MSAAAATLMPVFSGSSLLVFAYVLLTNKAFLGFLTVFLENVFDTFIGRSDRHSANVEKLRRARRTKKK